MDERANTRVLEMLGGAVEFKNLDHRLEALLGHFDCKDWTAVEFGCWHGWHTTQLARQFKRVIAVDARPDNVAATLLRLSLLGIGNVSVRLADVRSFQEPCDVLVHIGVLYHLPDPVAHLHRLPACQILCLDTHVNRPGLAPASEAYAGAEYTGGLYKESGWKDPLSGLEPTSLWLDEAVLRRILVGLGYWIVDERHYDAPPGPRVTFLAVRGQYV